MAMTMHVDIVSAEAEIYSGRAQMVFAPAVMGEVGTEESFYVSGGMLEVQPHVVTILADTAARAKDLDEAKAVAAKQRAEEALANPQGDPADSEEVRAVS